MKPIHALALAAVLAAESALFGVVASHRDAWIYPRWYDQLQYLGEAYDGYRQADGGGFAQGVRETLFRGSPQGALHGFLALLVFEAAGPSRMAALSLNLAAFLALQGATFLAVRRISGSFPVAWAAVGLLAALHLPWSRGPASAVDFRLDWMAACAYGVALAAGLAGIGLPPRRWAVLFGAAVGVAILTRFLTAVYFGLIYAGLLSWTLVASDRRRRCSTVALSAAVALAICAPALWRSRAAIHDYYWVGHIAGPERALRGSHLGVIPSVGWILSHLLDQVGLAAVAIGLGGAAALWVLGSIRRTRADPPAPADPALAGAWTWVLLFLAVPAVVLALHPQKAPQAVSILIPAAVWIIVLGWLRLARRARTGAAAAVCAAAALAGLVCFAAAETGNAPADALVAQYRRVNGLSDYVYFRAEESGLSRPRVAVTRFMDGLGAESFGIVGYERHRGRLRFVATLPTGLFAPSREAAMQGLAESDFVCLVTRGPAVWPFEREMADLLAGMQAWCEANLLRVGDLDGAEFSASLYERRSLARPGPAGVSLAGAVGAALRGKAYAPATPPGAPVILSPARLLGSTRAEFRYGLTAAYSPVRFGATGLPEGLRLGPSSGEIRGRFPRAGLFLARITATNPAGSTAADLAFQVEEQASFAFADPPASCAVGGPADIRFGAYDAAGTLDFVDLTDLTAGRQLGRIAAPAGQRQMWQGTYRVSFDRAGPRTLLLRFVRFDPARKKPYAFVDRRCELTVAP